MTMAHGKDYRDIQDITLPAMREYADKYDYTLVNVRPNTLVDTERPPSWWKLEAMMRAFQHGAHDILWLDADVLIIRDDKDIYSDFTTGLFGIVVHNLPIHGTVPNCGVWIVNRSFSMYLLKMSRFDQFHSSQHVWEQAALVHLLGGNHDKYPIVLPSPHMPYTPLPQEWNAIDIMSVGDGTARFYHAMRGPDRKDRLTRGIKS